MTINGQLMWVDWEAVRAQCKRTVTLTTSLHKIPKCEPGLDEKRGLVVSGVERLGIAAGSTQLTRVVTGLRQLFNWCTHGEASSGQRRRLCAKDGTHRIEKVAIIIEPVGRLAKGPLADGLCQPRGGGGFLPGGPERGPQLLSHMLPHRHEELRAVADDVLERRRCRGHRGKDRGDGQPALDRRGSKHLPTGPGRHADVTDTPRISTTGREVL